MALANKSFQLTSAQLCRTSSADRAYSNKSLHQLTPSLAQSVSTEQLSIAQLCYKAQFTTCSLRACWLTAAQLDNDNLAWIKAFQNSASAKPVADSPALQRGAFQQTSSAATASDAACFPTRALQETGATAAFTTTAAAPATTSYIASRQQTASATSVFAKSLVNKNFFTKQKLRTTQPHKGEQAAFTTITLPTRALTTRAFITTASTRALTTRTSTTTWTTRALTRALTTLTRPWTTRTSTRALPTRALPTTSLTTTRSRASYSLMSPTLLFSFRFIFMIGIFTSNSLPPSFNLDSFITCWDRELVKHDELKTSFQKKQLGNKHQLTTCWTKEVDNDNELLKHLLQKEMMEHLKDGQLRNKKQQHKITTQLQQHLCKNEKLVINQEIEKKNLRASSRRSLRTTACTKQQLSAAHLEEVQLQDLQLSKPLGEQQQKKELEKKEQLVVYKMLAENQLENDNFEQRVPDRQLQQNLLQVQNQLQISYQEQMLLQQLSFENSFDNQKPLCQEQAEL